MRGLNFWHIAYCQFNEICHMGIPPIVAIVDQNPSLDHSFHKDD